MEPNFWVQRYECHITAPYNAYVGGTKYDAYHGQVWYKGKMLFGLQNLDIKTRAHFLQDRASHSWCENKEKGTILDWVINEILNEEDKKEWSKKELEEQGFEWKYYTLQDNIRKQMKKHYGGGWKKDPSLPKLNRKLKGEFEKRPTQEEWDALHPTWKITEYERRRWIWSGQSFLIQ
jgi:hypothetical protein